jgi:hypothetical protein
MLLSERTPADEGASRWLVVAMLFLFMLINYADRAILGLAAEPIMRDLALDARSFGLVGSAFFLCFSVSALAAGFLINRLPSRGVLFWFAVAWSAAQAPRAGALRRCSSHAWRLAREKGPLIRLRCTARTNCFPTRSAPCPPPSSRRARPWASFWRGRS